MKRTLVALLVSLLALPALAGCLGGDDTPSTTEEEDLCGEKCDPDADVTEGFGKITGKIIDDAFNPIASANVTLRELELTTKTNEAGTFAFNDLEPGTYTVFAQKPPTHKANGKQVEVVPSDITEADIILELLPPPAQPYLDEQDKVGLIGCSFAYDPIQGKDFCSDVNSNAQSVFDFPLDSGLTTLVVALTSQGASLTGEQELSISFTKPPIEGIRGALPLEGTWEFNEENAWPTWQNKGETITVDVRANHEAAQPQLAYEQKIHLWMAFFYNGEPVPDGYSAQQDG